MTITPAQCRAARALIGWSQAELHENSGVAKKTITNFEKGVREPFERTIRDLQVALESAGIEFIPENGGGAGVRIKNGT